ncbi:MAG: hypothetical protein F4Z87_00490 [Gammaproteobacteria bacterium]|nr:hypothetical protein [Gammaproteobacteria bacterium]
MALHRGQLGFTPRLVDEHGAQAWLGIVDLASGTSAVACERASIPHPQRRRRVQGLREPPRFRFQVLFAAMPGSSLFRGRPPPFARSDFRAMLPAPTGTKTTPSLSNLRHMLTYAYQKNQSSPVSHQMPIARRSFR